MLLGVAVSLLAFTTARRLETDRIEREFEVEVARLAHAVQHQFDEHRRLPESVVSLWNASDSVRREEFHDFVEPLLPNSPQLRAIGLAPRVSAGDHSGFEGDVRRSGVPGFEIRERGPDGDLVRAAPGEDRYPVLYLEPLAGNEAALGFDLASEPLRREAMTRARDTGLMRTTRRLQLVQEPDQGSPGFLSALPIYRRGESLDAVDNRRSALWGFATLVFGLREVVEGALAPYSPAGLDLYIHDPLEPEGSRLLYLHPSRTRSSGQDAPSWEEVARSATLRLERVLDVGGRSWTLLAVATPGFSAVRRGRLDWVLLGAGLIFTALTGWIFAVTAKGTRAMAGVNAALQSEIVDRERAESEREAMQVRLLQAQKLESLGVLAGGVAHDFNNLLTVILGNASVALDSVPVDSEAYGATEEVVRASERAAMLTQQMLAYAGKAASNRRPIDLNRHVEEIAALLATAIPKKISLVLDLAPHLPAVEADEGQLQQLTMNLVINAAEACEDRAGRVCVRTGTEEIGEDAPLSVLGLAIPRGLYVKLEVEDDGPGMDDDTRARMFDPFFSTKFQGRGLGLATVLGIVSGHDGAILLRTAPGKGSTFTVLFHASSKEVAPSTDAKPDELHGQGLILVVDDEAMLRRYVESVLRQLGYDVLLAENGREAIDVFRQRGDEISCVLLDLAMPEMDGEEALHALRDLGSDVPVILSSGYADGSSYLTGTKAGPAVFLPKPYTPRVLGQTLKGVLGSRRTAGIE
jgi:signal transduction histidine kinase/CheY-like chemotaxis protein